MSSKPDYGLDAPGLVKFFIIGGIGLTLFSFTSQMSYISEEYRNLVVGLFQPGLTFVATGMMMIWSSYLGKFRARDLMLNSLQLKGTETVLDLGCGRGLILIGAAKRLTTGKAIGVDLWSQKDLSANSKEATLANAVIEGVSDRIEVIDGDMTKLPLADASVDVVTASMSIHNIPTREGRAQAVREALRVLKPGGKFALLDFICTKEYEATMWQSGVDNARRSYISFWNFPPSKTVRGQKP